ncbi:MAG: DUF3857 domain-containing protein [Piscinibacter sp.]
MSGSFVPAHAAGGSGWLRPAFAALLASLLIGSAGAQAAAEPPAQPPVKEVQLGSDSFTRGAPLPEWALPLAEVPATTRRAAVVLRLADTQLAAADSRGVLVNRAVQVNDNSSLAAIGQYTIQFVPQYQKLRLHTLRLLRGDESLDRMAQVQMRFLERETGLEGGVYSGAVTAVLLLADVRVGDTLQIVYSIVGENPVFGSTYADSASWDQLEPTELRRVTLLAPADRRLDWRMFGDYRSGRIRPTETMRGNLRVLQFEERGLDGVEPESHIPGDYLPLRFIQFSAYPEWNDVARWAMALFPPAATLPPELQPVIERLRALPDPAARAAAALQWVQEEIRYFSVSLGESSHRPYAPAEVVQRRYGDCKDKTYLLVTMLRELGIEATPVLVSLGNPRLRARLLPSPHLFDHVIARVDLGGASYFLDPTRLGQRGPLSRMGNALEGARGLPVRADARELITVSVPNALELATAEVREVFTLDSFDGDARLESRRTWNGSTAEVLRVLFGRMSPEQRKTQSTLDYERRYPGITLEGDLRIDDDVQRNTFAIDARYRVPKAAKEFGGDWALRFFPVNMQGAINLPPKLNRNFPAQVAARPYQAQYQLVVNWPDSVSVVRDPATQRVDSNLFRAQIQRSFRGNVATLNMQYVALADTVPAKDLQQVVQDIQKLERTVGGAVVVERAAIKSGGFLGLGKATLQQNLQTRMDTELKRVSATIAEGKLQGEDLAEALCTRAETLADNGKAAQGMADAQEAVRVAPALARAWQCRGNLLFATGEFARAVPDYTKSLGLGGEAFFNFYRRGHARFYAGQFDAAAADFAKAAEAKQAGDEAESTYARLWQAWALQRAGTALPAALVDTARQGAAGAWPRPAMAMLVGALTPEQLIAEVERKQGDERELTLAEAWFYVGQHHRAQGDLAKARQAYEKCRALGITMYIEHVAAGLELASLK